MERAVEPDVASDPNTSWPASINDTGARTSFPISLRFQMRF